MEVPSLICPICGRQLEYHITIELLDPPIGKIDTGYCSTCSRLFECIRQTKAYEPTMWMPVCRQCRQPVSFAGVHTADEKEIVYYECRDHRHEQWTWTRGTDEWTRR